MTVESLKNMDSSALPFKLQLTLDLPTHSDADTVNEMLDAFPAEIRPSVGMKLLLSDSSAPYIVLTVLAGIAWITKRILGPLFDELGNYLRDAIKAYLKRGKHAPPAIGLYISVEGTEDFEVRISIETKTLLGWDDAEPHFKDLREILAKGLKDVASKKPSWVSLEWDPQYGEWVFIQIFRSSSSGFNYWIFDRKQRKWVEKTDVTEPDDNKT